MGKFLFFQGFYKQFSHVGRGFRLGFMFGIFKQTLLSSISRLVL